MPIARISAGVLALLWLTGPAAYAQKSKGGPSTHGGGAKATAPTSHGSSHATGGPKTTTKTHGNPHTATATTTRTRGNPHTTNASTSTSTLNPIAQKLQGKPLGDRIQQMLPKNMTLAAAAAGFRNQGQFIAAVHVSQNLGIPFDQLKAAMLGTATTATNSTSTSPMSLGQAIQRLRPTVNAGAEVERAETQAAADASGTSVTSTTAATSAATSKKHRQ